MIVILQYFKGILLPKYNIKLQLMYCELILITSEVIYRNYNTSDVNLM